MATNFLNFGPILDAVFADVQKIMQQQTALSHQQASDTAALTLLLKQILALVASPSAGAFNPPPNLVKQQTLEVTMSVLQLEVGQTAVGKLTFDEITPPTDGAVATDNTAVTINLADDHLTWTCVAVSVTGGTPANVTYTGTSVAPDVGPAIVPPMLVTVIPVPIAEHGDFDPTAAIITGP